MTDNEAKAAVEALQYLSEHAVRAARALDRLAEGDLDGIDASGMADFLRVSVATACRISPLTLSA